MQVVTDAAVTDAVGLEPSFELTRQTLGHLLHEQVADVPDALVDGERRGAGGWESHVGVALRAGEGTEPGGPRRLDATDVSQQTAAAERVVARKHARIFILRRTERTRQEVQSARLGIVELMKTGVHVLQTIHRRNHSMQELYWTTVLVG